MEEGAENIQVDKSPSSMLIKSETIPLMEDYERMKVPRNEQKKIAERMMMSPISMKEENTPFNKKNFIRKRPMYREDEEIPLMEVYKRMKRRRLMSRDEFPLRKQQKVSIRRPISVKKIRSPLSIKMKTNSLIKSLTSIYEEEKKNTLVRSPISRKEEEKPIPVYESVYNNFDRYEEEIVESEEEVLLDGERDEDDWGCDFVVNDKKITYTRVKVPKKIYYRRDEDSVLHDKEFPIPTITKMALDRYNTIEGADYEYVGLVKAYKIAVDGFNYTIRFKARLPNQDPIYFQAMIYQ